MTAGVSQVQGLSREMAQIHQANLRDLKETLARTTQEMAEKRNENYFGARTLREPAGIINSFVLFMTVKSCDVTITLDTFPMAAQVKKDLELLEAVHKCAKAKQGDEVKNHLGQLLESGFAKDRLKKIFDAPTWNMIYSGNAEENKVCESILSAIEAFTPRPAAVVVKTEKVAIPLITESKRKEDKVENPNPTNPEKKAKVEKREPTADEILARELQDEEYARRLQNENQVIIDKDAAFAAQLAEEEFGGANNVAISDEEVAMRLQREENERLTEQLLRNSKGTS